MKIETDITVVSRLENFIKKFCNKFLDRFLSKKDPKKLSSKPENMDSPLPLSLI